MDLEQIIRDLSRADAYEHPVPSVEVIQTHGSVVFLAGEHVYKVKKPRNLGFLDYSTLERRRVFCRAEVELNRRLAPDVYLGVEALSLRGGRLRVGGSDPSAVEYAVHMRRLPESATLRSRWRGGTLHVAMVERVARAVAEFHATKRPDHEAAVWSRRAEVERNHADNFETLAAQSEQVIAAAVLTRLEAAATEALAGAAALLDRRASQGVACDGHGDLRTDHVYVREVDGSQPWQIDIVDCIEFDPRYRCGDPIADIAFLAVDLAALGAHALADRLMETYLEASGDEEGAQLVPLYRGYRATVRAKVEAIRAGLEEVPDGERREAAARARAWMVLALAELETPSRRPALVLVAGLPASGKSTVAEALVENSGFEWIRADVVRKRLAGVAASSSAAAPVNRGIYSPVWSDRTYDECLKLARRSLLQGGRVVVDATLLTRARRRAFRDAAVESGARVVTLVCAASESTTYARMAARKSGPSDADFEVYQALARRWEPLGPDEGLHAIIETDGLQRDVLRTVLDQLGQFGVG
ncbi:MAG: hypothetical protein B7733_04225 [Myxococcales bacterium FL481]|nr:MAG: hypothetical protein B7733_04225 [Myxococcales bacterium FL481]